MTNSSPWRVRQLTVLLLGVSLLLGAGCSGSDNKLVSWLSGEKKSQYPESPQVEQASLEVKQDRTFTIELASNESAGYRWTTQFSRPNIEFIKDEYIVNSRLVHPDSLENEAGETRLIAGAGGKHFFTFSAQERGYAQITFSYGKEGQATLKQVIYDINVK